MFVNIECIEGDGLDVALEYNAARDHNKGKRMDASRRWSNHGNVRAVDSKAEICALRDVRLLYSHCWK